MSILNHRDACMILGIEENAGRDAWKSVYREKCRMYHPDVLPESDPDRESNIENYILAKQAYEFLEKEYEASEALKKNTAAGTVAVPKGPKIMGTAPAAGSGDMAASRRARAKADEKARESKEERYRELVKKAEEIRKAEKEKHILDEIRWIRVAEIIRKTIEEDTRRKNAENALMDEIRSKQGNI